MWGPNTYQAGIVNPTNPATDEALTQGPTYRGAYNAAEQYWIGDIVLYTNGLYYMCISPTPVAIGTAPGAMNTASIQTWMPIGQTTKIAETILSIAGSFDFIGIPTIFRHLRLMIDVAGQAAGNLGITFNGDTGNNYDFEQFNGVNAAASAAGTIGAAYALVGSTALAGSSMVVDIPNYNNIGNGPQTRKYLSRAYDTSANGATQRSALNEGEWRGVVGINRITLQTPATLAAGSVVSLYGIM